MWSCNGCTFKINCALRSLDLSNNQIGYGGWVAIVEGMTMNNTLKLLDICNYGINDVVRNAISEAIIANNTLNV